MPAHPPSLAFQATAGGGGVAYASWNGATLVDSWRVLTGAGPSALSAAAQVARSGFETAITLPAGTIGPYVSVQAIDTTGRVLGASPAVSEPGLASGG
jgi:hypothetical protein